MKRPYLSQFERYLLLHCSKTSHAESIRFRLAWVSFIKEAKRQFDVVLKLILK